MIRSTERSISTRGPRWRGHGALLAGVAGLVLLSAPPLLAQTSPAPTPAREGNIYGHRDHQPTEAEVGAAALAAGIVPPSPASTAAVEKEVEDLLKQADRLDQLSEEQDEGSR